MKRRRLLELLSAAAAGAIALPYVPQKLYFVGGWPQPEDWAKNTLEEYGSFIKVSDLTYGDLTAEQRTFYSQQLIKRLLPNLPLERYLENTPRVIDTGESIQFRRWGEFAVPSWPAEMAIRPRSELALPPGAATTVFDLVLPS